MKYLKPKKVKVVPIKRARGMVKDPSHIAYFMMPGITNEFTVPRSRMGSLVTVLSSEEQKELEKAMGLDEGTLSPHRQKNNFWTSKKAVVKLSDKTYQLDLSNPEDYIRYKILLSNRDLVAPDESSKFDKATYIYYITSEEERIDARVSKSKKIKRAYQQALALEESKTKLRDFLIVYGRRPADTLSKDALIAEIDNIIEHDVDGFLATCDDPLFNEKLILLKAVRYGFVKKEGTKFLLPTGDMLCNKGESPTLVTAAKYIASPENQEILLTLTAKIEKKEDGR